MVLWLFSTHLIRQSSIDALHDIWEFYHQLQRHNIARCTHALVCPCCSLPAHLHASAC